MPTAQLATAAYAYPAQQTKTQYAPTPAYAPAPAAPTTAYPPTVCMCLCNYLRQRGVCICLCNYFRETTYPPNGVCVYVIIFAKPFVLPSPVAGPPWGIFAHQLARWPFPGASWVGSPVCALLASLLCLPYSKLICRIFRRLPPP